MKAVNRKYVGVKDQYRLAYFEFQGIKKVYRVGLIPLSADRWNQWEKYIYWRKKDNYFSFRCLIFSFAWLEEIRR